MVNGSLNDYVRQQLQRGYPPEAVRTSLIQAGYNPQDIDFALRVATRPAERRIMLTGRNLAITVGGILAVVLLVVAGVLIFRPAAKDIQIALRVQPPSVQPGESLALAATLSSEQARSVPVSLEYLVQDPFTRKAVTSRSERLEVGMSAFVSQDIPIPATLAPGEYEARVTARFEGISRIQAARFTVLPAVVVTPKDERALPPEELALPIEDELECPPSCDDLNPATEDSCVRGSCVHTLKEGVCGNTQCEDGENRVICPEDCGAAQDVQAVQDRAVTVARSDPEKAATLCNSLIVPTNMDACFATIANVSGRSALCANIQDTRTRDDCLMDFAFAGDYTVCGQISNKYFLTSCQSLQRFSAVKQEQAASEQEAREAAAEAAAEE